MTLKPPFLTLFVALFLCIMYAPNIILMLFAFSDATYQRFPIEGWTLDWFRQLSENERMIEALVNSLRIGVAVAAISTVLGAGAAYALTYHGFPLRKTSLTLIGFAIVAPVMILALALTLTLQTAGLRLSSLTVLIGHLVICMPFATYVIVSRMSAFDLSLEEAARDLGLGPFRAFLRVWLPLAGPAIISAALLTFTISFDDFMMAFFLGGNDTTLPIYIWGQLRYPQRLPQVLALATIVFCVSILLVIVAELLRRRGTGPSETQQQASDYDNHPYG